MILDHKVGMIVHFSSPLVELANPEKIFGKSLASRNTIRKEEFKDLMKDPLLRSQVNKQIGNLIE